MGAPLNYDDDSSSVDDNKSFNNEDDNYHNNDDDDDDDEEIEAAPVGNSKRQQGTIEEDGGGGGGEEDNNEGAWDECVWLDQKSKSKMSDIELRNYYNTELQKMGASTCSNPQCNCLAILRDGRARSSVLRYLAWFSRREKQVRDMIVFEWYRYSSFVKKRGQGRMNYYRLPYIDDGTEAVPKTVRNHVVCTRGMQSIMSYRRTSFGRIAKASIYSSVLPLHKSTGKTNYNSIDINNRKLEPLLRHFEYLKKLGEV